MAIARRIPVLVKATTNRHDLPRTVLLAPLLDQALNSEVGERQDPVFSDAIDPDDTVFDFHFIGDVPQPILVFSEIPGDLGDGRA